MYFKAFLKFGFLLLHFIVIQIYSEVKLTIRQIYFKLKFIKIEGNEAQKK